MFIDGLLNVNLSANVSWLDVVLATGNQVTPGGEWMPANCAARYRLAVIIPFRDRDVHLRILLRHLLPILQRQMVHFRVFIVEQVRDFFFCLHHCCYRQREHWKSTKDRQINGLVCTFWAKRNAHYCDRWIVLDFHYFLVGVRIWVVYTATFLEDHIAYVYSRQLESWELVTVSAMKAFRTMLRSSTDTMDTAICTQYETLTWNVITSQHICEVAYQLFTRQHIAEMSLCCEVISSFVIFAVLVLRFCCSRIYKML